jgi:hypothetical protein
MFCCHIDMVPLAGFEVLLGKLEQRSASCPWFGTKENIGYTIKQYVVLTL